ncbi:MAG: hypothetical protein ACOYMP_12640 [Nodosilinea sp.]
MARYGRVPLPIHLPAAIACFGLVTAAASLQPLQADPGTGELPWVEPTGWLSQLPNHSLELDPAILNQSPVLQRWLQAVPDVGQEINYQPAFRPRLRGTYNGFPAKGETGGFQVGLEDIFLMPGTGLALSADYGSNGNGQHRSYGLEARYYLFPLGGYVNLAPTLGYRDLSTPDYSTGGMAVGLRLMLVPSRGGGADLALGQQWVSPGQEGEVGVTSVALGYAVTSQLRLATDLQFQSSRLGYDSRWGLGLEWLL